MKIIRKSHANILCEYVRRKSYTSSLKIQLESVFPSWKSWELQQLLAYLGSVPCNAILLAVIMRIFLYAMAHLMIKHTRDSINCSEADLSGSTIWSWSICTVSLSKKSRNMKAPEKVALSTMLYFIFLENGVSSIVCIKSLKTDRQQ